MLFETSLHGLEVIEKCQFHFAGKVYRMAQKLLRKHFEIEQNPTNLELVQFLNSITERPEAKGEEGLSCLAATMSSVDCPE